jgi:hypothetical protein
MVTSLFGNQDLQLHIHTVPGKRDEKYAAHWLMRDFSSNQRWLYRTHKDPIFKSWRGMNHSRYATVATKDKSW